MGPLVKLERPDGVQGLFCRLVDGECVLVAGGRKVQRLWLCPFSGPLIRMHLDRKYSLVDRHMEVRSA